MLTRRIFRLNFWNSKIMELSDLFFRLTNRFRITYSLKILSKSNHSSKHNSFQSRTRVSHFSSHFTNHYTIPNFIKNHRSILFNHLLLLPSPSTQIYFRHSSNDPTIEIPLALPFSSKRKKKKEKSLHPPYISLSHPWTLISNLKQFPISFWNRSENQSTASSKRKKGREGKKLLPTIPNLYKPSYRIYLHVRSSSTSIGTTVCERGHRPVNPNIRFSPRNRSDPL